MTIRDYRLPLAVFGLVGLFLVLRLAMGPLARVNLPAEPELVPAASAGEVAPRISADSVSAIASRDPFRIGHRPALPAYDPLRLAEQLAPPLPRPTLLLVGVMEGREPSAVIEGFPGVEGARVVRRGDVIGGLAIRKVGSGRVLISGMDTTWVLEVREPWKN
ncbi:MAG TPA: hypothetical protein VFO67_17710 [Gemmatimonadales bacterium]|nr:hypothetical protein [Gemmatimonadales bacterium]